jgi:predicted AlkP superfamily pyrophosphatase or phosphodiesterase
MKKLTLFIFIDALGWEVLRGRKFMEAEFPFRRKLRSVFGYSSACVPSILSGLTPAEHGHWSFYYYSPETSPFSNTRPLKFLPFQSRGRVRHQLSKFLKRRLGWEGYFQLYNMPLESLSSFDYCEKKDLFSQGGLNRGQHIVDQLAGADISYHISNWRNSEVDNIAAASAAIEKGDINFAFLYLAEMDALLHEVGKHSELVDEKLAWYESRLSRLIEQARQQYGDVAVHICSDHGMASVTTEVDLMSRINKTGLRFDQDYAACFDSTMARFWFKNERARAIVVDLLENSTEGRILMDAELEELGCLFEGNQYGELVYLVDPGTIICPSHMGTTTIAGMHGYHPDHCDSDAVLLSSNEPVVDARAITDLNALMRAEVGCA